MKAINILKTIASVLIIATFTACVQDDDYTVPTDLGVIENLKLSELLADATYSELTIQQVKDQFVFGTATQIVSSVYVKGYVVSSDETGNFYKEFYMQDHPTNPTAGIKVILNSTDNFAKYNLGREVYINLTGLYVGETKSGDGVLGIGGDKNADGDEIEAITTARASAQILRADVTEIIVGLPVSFSQINSAHIGTFVTVSDAQFPSGLSGESYVDAYDDYDSPRTMEACDGFGYTNFILESSTFASFKNELLPTGGGTISGVISKDYYGDNMVMVINTTADVVMNDTRCTPLDIADFSVIFSEDFDAGTDNSNLDFAGWTNFAEAGGELWTEQVYSGNGYAEFSSWSTGDSSNIGWLVSPGIDMDAQENEFLNFETAQHHLDSADNTLEVFVSSDFDGTNVLAATWTPVSANLASMSDSWYSFIDSGLVDLSGYTGTLHVAFKVTGSGTDSQLDGAYHVENFSILATM